MTPCVTCQVPLKNGNTKYCSHKCRRRKRNFICKNCGNPFDVKQYSERVYCSWACVLQSRKPKKIDKDALIRAMRKYRHGEYPNFAAIARVFKTRNGIMVAKWAKSYGIVDQKMQGPVVDGVYLPIFKTAIKSHPIKKSPLNKNYLKKRLFKRREIDPITHCWIWTGHWDDKGYGKMRIARPFDKEIGVHIVATHIWLGEPLPTTKIVFRKCNNRACFNPDHFILCENRVQLGKLCSKYGKRARGEKSGRAVISLTTALDVRDALNLGDETPKQIADRLGIKSHIVWQIAHKKTWKHIWKLKSEYQEV